MSIHNVDVENRLILTCATTTVVSMLMVSMNFGNLIDQQFDETTERE